ncbi:MAG: hypothetical protein K1X55_16160 [Chitinophagales bacterium]|nr:hypothetical protein [Chitinophagales bacterium]
MRITKYVIIAFLLIILMIFWRFLFPVKQLNYIIDSSDNNGVEYIDYYYSILPNKLVDNILIELVHNNNDASLIESVTWYAYHNEKYFLLPELKERANYFKQLPKDTILTVKKSRLLTKEISLDFLYSPNGFFDLIDTMEKECVEKEYHPIT